MVRQANGRRCHYVFSFPTIKGLYGVQSRVRVKVKTWKRVWSITINNSRPSIHCAHVQYGTRQYGKNVFFFFLLMLKLWLLLHETTGLSLIIETEKNKYLHQFKNMLALKLSNIIRLEPSQSLSFEIVSNFHFLCYHKIRVFQNGR